MEDNLISIIIPVYNSEKYLYNLFKSIDSQKYKNYEIILINDGSTDSSEEICKKYASENSKVRYFYKENGGVSNTRNFGIQKSIGEFICFVDSDDIISPDYLSDFIKEIGVAEIACCNLEKFKDSNSITDANIKLKIEKIYNKNNKYEMIYDKYGGYIANKMFRRKIIVNNNIQMNEEIYMMEDMLFIFEYLKYVNKIICINKNNYKYRMEESAASKNLKNTKWFSLFKTLDKIIDNKKIYSKKTYNKVIYSYIFYLYQAKFRLKKIEKNNKLKNALKKDINQRIYLSKKEKRILSLKQKIKLFIYKYFNNIAFEIKIYRNRKS